MDPLSTAVAIAVCDLIGNEVAKLRAVLALLEKKGLVSSAELNEAIQSIQTLPLESVQDISNTLQEAMRARIAQRYQEMILLFGKQGPPQ